MADRAAGCSAYIGGLGSGKTWAAAWKFLYFHELNQCEGLCVAPTLGDLWRFVVPQLIGACDQLGWECTTHPTGAGLVKVAHMRIRGRIVYLISAETPERFAGFQVGHIWVDEGARIGSSPGNPLRDAPTQIRTRLRHPNAKRLHLMVTTTPEGCETWVHNNFVEKPLPGHRAYFGSTHKNIALPPEYISNLMGSLPPELLKQYLEGQAVSFAMNRAHPGFTAANIQAIEYRQNLPVHIGLDYNVDPMCWVLCQVADSKLLVLDEQIITGGTTVDVAVRQAHQRGWGKYPKVTIYPDKSSKARSTTGDSEWLVTTQTASALNWRWDGNAYGVNPPVAARIANLSRLCLNGLGQRDLIVHHRCVRVINELERTSRLASGGYDPGPENKRGHILDALGYVAWQTNGPISPATVGRIF